MIPPTLILRRSSPSLLRLLIFCSRRHISHNSFTLNRNCLSLGLPLPLRLWLAVVVLGHGVLALLKTLLYVPLARQFLLLKLGLKLGYASRQLRHYRGGVCNIIAVTLLCQE